MKAHTIHTIRFYKPTPKAAHTLAYSKQRKLLAVSREDGTIEVFNFKNPNAPLLEQCIPGHGNELDRSIEAMAFVRDGRLFSVGLHGFVFQHHVCQRVPERSSSTPEFWPVTSGAAWCMKYNDVVNKLAVGTEEGFVCIFDVIEEGLSFDKILDKQEGRVMSLDWHVDGKHIVTGSTDTLRLWDVESGHPLQRMSTGRLERNLETTVWSVLFLTDFTVVSGDSRGKTSFWNGKNGTLIDSYQSHKADILSIAINEEQTIIYAAGIDPTIVHFQPVVKGAKSRWIKSISRNVNTHDVHALTVLSDLSMIVSVGVDANLIVDDSKRKSCSAHPPFRWGANVALAPKAKIAALKYTNSVEVWKLGSSAAPQQTHPNELSNQKGLARKPVEILKVTQEPVKLLDVKCASTETLSNIAISRNAEYLAYATLSKFKVLKLSLNPLQIQKVAISVPRVPHLMNLSHPNKLLVADTQGQLTLFNLDGNEAIQVWSHNVEDKFQLKHGISHIDMDEDAFAVIADHACNVLVIDLATCKVQCKPPKYEDAPISCMAVHPKTKNLMLVYSDHHFVECCTKTGKYTKLTNILHENQMLPKEWKRKGKPTRGILFPQAHLSGLMSKKSDTVMFYDEEFIAVLDRHSVMNDVAPSATKVAKKGHTNGIAATTGSNEPAIPCLRMSKRYEHLVYLDTLPPENSDDITCPLVAVEVKPSVLESQLPPSIRQKKFGAM